MDQSTESVCIVNGLTPHCVGGARGVGALGARECCPRWGAWVWARFEAGWLGAMEAAELLRGGHRLALRSCRRRWDVAWVYWRGCW